MDTPTPTPTPAPPPTAEDTDRMVAALDETPAGSVAATDLSGLLRAAEEFLNRIAEASTDSREERRARQLSTIIDHVRRVQQSESPGYIVEKSTVIVDAALQLELDARADTAVNAGAAQLIDDGTEQVESFVRRVRPVLVGLAGDDLTRDQVRPLIERAAGLGRWGQELDAMANVANGGRS